MQEEDVCRECGSDDLDYTEYGGCGVAWYQCFLCNHEWKVKIELDPDYIVD